jgi:hypothetical protein
MKKLLLASLMIPALGAYAQTKKVVIEDYTGVNCCWCPEGSEVIKTLQTTETANTLAIQIHTGGYTPASSPLRTAEGDAIDNLADPAGYPNGSVDRAIYTPASATKISMGRNYWTPAFQARKAMPAIVSISFANAKRKTATDYEVDVKVKFTSAPTAGTPVKLQIVPVEDKIAATTTDPNLAQKNCSPNFKPGETPLQNYFHNNVMRKPLSGTWGYTDAFPATPVVNTEYTKKVTFSVPAGASPTGWVKDNVRLIAFVHYDGGTDATKHEILNGEEIQLKSFAHPTAVADVQTVSVGDVYPNPATVNNVVHMEYNIAESALVTAKILNVAGQVVAVPMENSNEVAGTHTFQWKAADYNLPAGMYLVQFTTSTGGSFTQKVNIQ